jgi:hypothetical protein
MAKTRPTSRRQLSPEQVRRVADLMSFVSKDDPIQPTLWKARTGEIFLAWRPTMLYLRRNAAGLEVTLTSSQYNMPWVHSYQGKHKPMQNFLRENGPFGRVRHWLVSFTEEYCRWGHSWSGLGIMLDYCDDHGIRYEFSEHPNSAGVRLFVYP